MSVDVAGLQITIRELQTTIGQASMRVRTGDVAVADILLREAQRLALVCEQECKAAAPNAGNQARPTSASDAHDE